MLGLACLACLALAWPGLPLSLACPCQQQQKRRREAPPPLCGFPYEACWQGKTNSAEPRQSKPGSRAKSAGPKVGLRPPRWLGQQVWCSDPGANLLVPTAWSPPPGPHRLVPTVSDCTSCFRKFVSGFWVKGPDQLVRQGPKSENHTLNPSPATSLVPQNPKTFSGPGPGPKGPPWAPNLGPRAPLGPKFGSPWAQGAQIWAQI